MNKKYYRIKLKDGYYYAQYRLWFMPFYITIDFSRIYNHALFYIESNKENRIVYDEAIK